MNKKILLASLLSVVTLVSCGPEIPSEPSQPSEPAKESVDALKDDLNKNVTLKLSVNYNAETGMKYNNNETYVTPKGTTVKKVTLNQFGKNFKMN